MDPTSPFSETRSSQLSGRLQGQSVPDLMWQLCRGRKTGVLRLTRGDITKTLYLEEGRIIFATSNDPDERLGEMLLREGLITLDQFESSVSHLDTGKRLGTLLVEAGNLTPDNLVRSVLSQVRGIVLSVFAWEEGDYRFDEASLPGEEVITLSMQTGELLLQGIRQVRSFDLIRRRVGPPWSRYRLAAAWRDALEGLPLTDAETTLLGRFESGPQLIEKVCREVFLSNFEIYQALWAFRVLGVFQRDDRLATEDGAGRSHGQLGEQEFADLLVRLNRQGETGVLEVTRGPVERTFHIKEGRCVFATSNQADDGLVAHLLRRGVISLQDREEVSKRLLTNKRVGTILLEMGVLDEKDLEDMVREQLGEIVHDTVSWQDGGWVFLAGELPTIEDITLDSGLEDLVACALRRVTSWSRVLRGCGGLDATLTLTPEYLPILDRMSVGGDEWDVVTILRAPRTAREICRASPLGGFRVCQILWALRLLGAVAEAPAQAVLTLAEVGPAPSEEWDTAAPPLPIPSPVYVEPLPAAPVLHPFESDAEASAPSPPPEAPTLEEAAAAATEPFVEEVSEPQPEPHRWESAVIEEEPTAEPAAEEASLEEQPETPEEAAAAATEPIVEEVPEPQPEALRWESAVIEEEPPAEPAPSTPFEIIPAATGRDLSLDSPLYETRFIPRQPGSVREEPETAPVEEPRPAQDVTEPLTGESEYEATTDDAPELETELDRLIASFNARQRLVYRAIRSEIGAGAANFVRYCGTRLGDGFEDLFAPVELLEDGSWDALGLKSSMQQRTVVDPWIGFQRLLDKELEMVHLHLGHDRAQALRKRLEELNRDRSPS